ncbi:MAG: MCE family protein, partial [Rhodobacter sp.]|nr:MCE family protein [Rhodobacter sp.]
MAENPSEVIAGAAVLAAAVGFLVYAGQSTGFTGNAASYPLVASFRSVDGVTVGTDVRLAGVKVGTVTALELNPQTFFADAT